ncbi:MAG: holo-ACP synthase [Treponema sp.]|uniref:holo-ACP synthase n=1 Tax=Treponema sp. TaxID=166 RepID=UPI001B5139DF|nr:holo-ACP synthase [Treponema sp.]MBP5402468.1 holo-ACP synthase [Treponema sp.]MBR5933265.1 holo-ACP synthase [Treponema sp.]
MIFGIGIDLAKVSRFNKWIEDKNLLEKYFNEKEMILTDGKQLNERRISSLSQHYAARFAAKEAFSKALGTGISGFKLKDVYIQNEESGKPCLVLENSAREILDKMCPNAKVFVSLSHEKEFAIAQVIIEI